MESLWGWEKGDGEKLPRTNIFGCKIVLSTKNTFCILKYTKFQDIQQGVYLTEYFGQ